MNEDYLVFGRPLIGDLEIAEVVDSLKSGWIGTGPKVTRFEAAIEQYVGAPNVRCLSSCTAGLIIALRALGIGRGDEVVVPTMTFAATVNVIELVGATPVLVDCEPETGLIDLQAAEASITKNTRAIMPVHLWGRPLDMTRVQELADKYEIEVIEDAAHALGAEWKGKKIGSHGNFTAFSFYVTKNITTGEGGALVCPSAEESSRVEQLSLHGLSTGAWQRFSDAGYRHYEVSEPGFKFNMTDVQAAMGLHQLPKLDEWIGYRAGLWDLYNTRLIDLPVDTPPSPAPDSVHARHLYTISVRDEAGLSRDEVMQQLHDRGIGTGVHYRAIHLHPFYRDKYQLRKEDFPEATYISERTLSLPMSQAVTLSDAARVAEALSSVLLND